jgi:hypothetical protein
MKAGAISAPWHTAVTLQDCAVLARRSSAQLSARPDAVLRVLRQETRLRHYLPLVERVMAQTQARVFEAKRHYAEKILAESGSSVAGSAGILGGL